MQVAPNTSYTVSFWYYNPGSASGAATSGDVQLNFNGSYVGFVGTPLSQAIGIWKQCSIIFTTGNTTALTMFFVGRPGMVFYIDDLVIQMNEETGSYCEPFYNLIDNGDVEEAISNDNFANLPEWITRNSTKDTNAAANGGYYLTVNAGRGNGNKYVLPITIPKAGKYVFGISMKATSSNNVKVYLVDNINTMSLSRLLEGNDYNFVKTFNNNSQYERLSFRFSTSTDNKQCYLVIGGNVGKADIDAIQLFELKYAKESDQSDYSVYSDSYEEVSPVYGQVDASLSIANTTPVCTNYLGQSAEYFSYSFMNEYDQYGRAYSEEMLDLEINRVVESGVSLVRCEYYPEYAFDYQNNVFDFNTKYMNKFSEFLQAMKENNIDVAISPCYGWKYIYDAVSPNNFRNPLFILADKDANDSLSDSEKNDANALFGQWVAQSVDVLVNQKNFTNLKYVILFTEPGYASGIKDTEKIIAEVEPVVKPTISVDTALTQAGIRNLVKIVGPCTADTWGITQLKYIALDSDAKDCYDIFAWHLYAISEYTADKYSFWYDKICDALEQIKSTGKELWLDEFGWTALNKDSSKDPINGTQYSIAMIAAMNAGVQTTSVWSLASQLWLNSTLTNDQFTGGVHHMGLLPYLEDSTIPRYKYYSWSMIANYTKDGTVYAGTGNNGVYTTAIQNKNGEWTVIVVNMNSSEKKFSLDFDNAINKKLYRHTYDPATQNKTVAAEQIGVDGVISTVSDSFSDTICAYGVQVYTSINQ